MSIVNNLITLFHLYHGLFPWTQKIASVIMRLTCNKKIRIRISNLVQLHPGCTATKDSNEPVHEKTNNLGSEQVQHKPACTVTEETQNLENLGISRGGNVQSV